MAFRLNEKYKLEINVTTEEKILKLEFTTPNGTYIHSLSLSDLTKEDITVNNLHKAIGSICSRIISSIESN